MLFEHFQRRPVFDVVKISFEVHLQDPSAVVSVFPEVFPQMIPAAKHGKVDPFAFYARAVVVYQGPRKDRHKGVVA